jgi:sugar/nucleoside kinase (ribokinase family)
MGAGDAYLAVTAPCVAAGTPMEVAAFVGGAAAALAVGIVGNRTSVDAAAVRRFVTAVLE